MVRPSTRNDGSQATQRLYVWLSREADGREDVIARPMFGTEPHAPVIAGLLAVAELNGIVPLLSTDMHRALSLEGWAQITASARRRPALLVAFTRLETLRIVEP